MKNKNLHPHYPSLPVRFHPKQDTVYNEITKHSLQHFEKFATRIPLGKFQCY